MFQSAPKLNETVPKNGCLPEKCLCKENQFIRICQKEYIKFQFIKEEATAIKLSSVLLNSDDSM